MGLASREKGKRGERLLVKELKALGFTDARRGQQVSGIESADLVGVAPGLRFESKHGNPLVPKGPYDWLGKLTTECSPDEFPVVCMHRTERNNAGVARPWLVVLPLRTFTAVARRWLRALGYTVIPPGEKWTKVTNAEISRQENQESDADREVQV